MAAGTDADRVSDGELMNGEITRYERKKSAEDHYLWAMWLMFLRSPGRKTGPGECVDLGEIGETRLQDQRLNRDTPYSICKGLR